MNKTNLPLYIRGWKGLQEYTGYHERTLRTWHYYRAKLPFIKTHVYSRTSRWVVTPERVDSWMELLGEPFKKNDK